MKKIAILGHWHTGTSLIAHQLKACGMEVGNENTGWTEECEAPCEHSYLNQMGDQLLLGNIDAVTALDNIRPVLRSYRVEAERLGWECYGVKVTHALQRGAWEVFRAGFDEEWGEDVLYVVTVRHPFAVIRSTINREGNPNNNWPPRQIYASIVSCIPATEFLLTERNTVIVGYPNTWHTRGISILAEKHLGLKWNEKAEGMFDSTREWSFTERELVDFSGIYPHQHPHPQQ